MGVPVSLLGKGATYSTVMMLMEGFLDQGYCTFMDNHYTSPTLFQELLARGTDAVGTCRKNRLKFPTELTSAKLRKGESLFLKYDGITACRFHEKRDVYLLSTTDKNKTGPLCRKGSSEPMDVPCIITSYNKAMGGVDLGDQYLVYYAPGRKSMKWYRRVIWRLIDLAVLNAFIIYRERHVKAGRIRQLGFRLDLSKSLVQPYLHVKSSTLRPHISSPTVAQRLIGKHFPHRQDRRGRCHVCGNKRKRGHKTGCQDTKTYYFCTQCDVYLCVGDCFMKFHTLVDYTH